MAGVELKAVGKRYGSTTAVHPLELSVVDGEFLTLLGPSGCGKTTTLRMVAGFVSPTSGSIFVGGRDVTSLPPQKRSMGMVFQDYSLFPHLSIEDNIAFALVERRVPSAQRTKRVAELLELIRLPDIAARYPSELSGGQQQRVALARALAHTPSVLLMDEPFGALDAKLRMAMQDELRSIQRQLGITTLFVTHDQAEAMHMSDRIAVMNQGRIEQLDAPRALYDRPQTRFVADFVGRINFVDGVVAAVGDASVEVDALGVRLPVAGTGKRHGREVTLALRPERIRILAPGEIAPGVVVIPGSIRHSAYLGNVMHTHVQTDPGAVLVVETPAHEAKTGDRIRVAFSASDVALIAGHA